LRHRELLDKARTAARSAQALLDDGDQDGACNRAYYAVFDAARALLVHSRPEAESESIRTHRGLISVFGQFVVKSGILSPDYGRFLGRLHNTRMIADYDRMSVSREQAEQAVKDAQHFFDEVAKLVLAAD
jgi:uncharacterized protein (UPF0332 family)